MHIEVLVEDSSGEKLLQHLLPQLLGPQGYPHSWRLHSYKGIGRIPKNLTGQGDPAKRFLLDQLRRVLSGYANTPGYETAIVVLDADKRDCRSFLSELQQLAQRCAPSMTVMFRLAIEETEAWLLGDRAALMTAYPRAKRDVLGRYIQDSTCDTWELLADAVFPGGSAALRKAGWPLPGQIKHEWAERIGPVMNLDANVSPSFCKFRDGLRRLVA